MSAAHTRPQRFFQRFFQQYDRARRDAALTLGAWPVLFAALLTAVVLLGLGLGTVIIGVGIPVMALGLRTTSYVASIGRRAVARADGTTCPGAYRAPAAGASWLRRYLTILSDPQRWLDALWVFLGGGPVGGVIWAMALVVVLVPVACILEPIGLSAIRHWGGAGPVGRLGLPPTMTWTPLTDVVICALTLLAGPFILRGLVSVQLAVTRALVCSSGRVGLLKTSRAAIQRAEADTRTRLERDIHDGPQQRLVRLGMDLARAKRQTGKDPQAAADILAGAMTQTQEALDELRRLSRGIAPPVLVDRGLAAALEEVAARSAVPVTVRVSIPQLPDHVAHAAYFVASEALANLNKHSGAVAAELGAGVDGGRLHLWVHDDGVGGACAAKGHGLAGLVDRLEGVDGTLAVTSPVGGPTRVEAVIPCES